MIMKGLFEILSPGILMTIQDRGRYGFTAYGVPVSGACDRKAYHKLNSILGNREGAACVEVTGSGGSIRISRDAVITLTGGDLGPCINGNTMPMYERVQSFNGDILEFTGMKTGLRAYLSAEGGIYSPEILCSKSTCLNAAIGERLKRGDILCLSEEGGSLPEKTEKDSYIFNQVIIRVIPGPDDERFDEQGFETFFSSEYTVSPLYDRMGIRLLGNKISHRDRADVLSHGVIPGSIQVPGSGMPIILMNDAQTSGGYAVIGNVIGDDMSLLAQVKQGDRILFKKTELQGGYHEKI
jgi:antagonist of KipI